MLFEILIVLIILFILYKVINVTEGYSIVYPFKNEYHPYTNPFSYCLEDVYGNMRCYDPMYFNKYFLPYYYKYPRKYKSIYKR